MKNLFFAAFIFSVSVISCSKKEPVDLYSADSPKSGYDTVAVDSFSNGAVSVDVARQIRMSSQQYQDSVKKALKIQEDENKLKDELEKEDKKKAAEKKQKAEGEKSNKLPVEPENK
ncbi:hypothetical protein MKJ01_03940 [Chryseobacterium sp. SSA4.19]|uniref:hypothetical protein n=1 Tax=Chryseobacterium sp. SSA4.19 TaxID=2919915 RepID=UPI001F4DB8E5|nr:hypothetical protein [Chryseobacterium sp. SSA4.19]MCJ8152913.1 hypothetical protein [Chryseobacterium sp. SSA4.19]